MKSILLIFILSIASSCSTFSSKFTNEKIMQINQGMESQKIVELFGQPKDIRQAICGSSVGKPWTCVTWEYGGYDEDRASFTFSKLEDGTLLLNNFNIDRE